MKTTYRIIILAVAIVALLALWVLGLVTQANIPNVNALASAVPGRTALMREREQEAQREGKRFFIDQRWVPYDGISPMLRRAVLIAEDDAFYSHDGLDWNEIKSAARKNLEAGRIVRGGSTITQQLAKNLYLGASRTPARKIKEAIIAGRLEHALSKRRIFELYLNLIEWGDGIFGAEAAAQRYFGVPASDLSARQAILLAAVIINPRRYSVLGTQKRIDRRVAIIAGRMRRRGYISEDDYLVAMGRPKPHPWWEFWAKPETTAVDTTLPPEEPLETTEPEESTAVAAPDTLQ